MSACACTSFCYCGGCLVYPPTWEAADCKPHAPHLASCDAPGVYADALAGEEAEEVRAELDEAEEARLRRKGGRP